MKFALYATPLMVALLLLAGCSRSHEDVMEDGIEKMEELADILDDCKTAEDVKAREGEIKELAEEMKELKEETEGMDELSEDERKELMEKHGERMMKVTVKLMQAAMRFAEDEEVTKMLQKAMSGMK